MPSKENNDLVQPTNYLQHAVQDHIRIYLNALGEEATRAPGQLHQMTIRAIEKILLQEVLMQCRGNQSKATLLLGISRTTLRNKIAEYGIVTEPAPKKQTAPTKT